MYTAVLLALCLMPGRVISKPIAPGVAYTNEVLTDPPTVIHVLRVSMNDPKISVRVGLATDAIGIAGPAKGRETVGSLAKRMRATAAVNGDFFPFTGDPLGLCIMDGDLVSEPARNRAALGWTRDGTILVGNPRFSAVLLGPQGTEVKISGVNRDCGPGESILWLPTAGSKASCTKKGTAVILRGLSTPIRYGSPMDAMVAEVRRDVDGVSIPADGAVLFVKDARGEPLNVVLAGGGVWTLMLGLEDGAAWNQAAWAVGGGPWLVKGGKKYVDAAEEKFDSAFVNKRHPRTAVGQAANGDMIIAVIEGRSEDSGGMSLDELADTMLRYGAVNAINLDGGGSSEMVLRDLQVSAPSEGQSRPVANAILIFAPTDQPSGYLSMQPKVTKLKVGATFQWTVKDAKTGTPVGPSEAFWSCTLGIGKVDQYGQFTAARVGTAVVSAYCRGSVIRSIVLIEP